MNSQDNMPSPEASNPISTCPEESNLAETQDKDFNIRIVNILKDLKGHEKLPNKDHEHFKI